MLDRIRVLLFLLVLLIHGCAEDPLRTARSETDCDGVALEDAVPAPGEVPHLHAVEFGTVRFFFSNVGTPSATRGFITVGSGGTEYTSTVGELWVPRHPPIDRIHYDFTATEFGEYTVGTHGLSYVTRDGGWYGGTFETNGALFSVAHSPTHIVAVGEAGLVVTSEDGRNYQSSWIAGSSDLVAVAPSQGDFYAADDEGRIWSATDPADWTQLPAVQVEGLQRLAVLTQQLVIVTDAGDLMYLEPGGTWLKAEVPAPIRGVKALDDAFFAVGDCGTVLRSADGIDWEDLHTGSLLHLVDIAEGDGYTVAVGRDGAILRSSDLNGWEQIVLQAPYKVDRGFRVGSEYWFFDRALHSFRSVTGESWTRRPNNRLHWTDIAEGDHGFVGVSNNGAILTFTDPEVWSHVDSPTRNNLDAVIWTGEKYVAAGFAGTIVESDDGTEWREVIVQGVDLSDDYIAGLLMSAEAKVLALTLATSVVEFDADWNGARFDLPPTSEFNDNAFDLLRFDGSYFFRRRHSVYRSDDLTAWTTVLSPDVFLRHLATNGSELVAVGAHGAVYRSDDGLNWNKQTISIYDVQRAVWGDSGWVLSSIGGRFYREDGGGWVPIDLWD